LQEICYGKRSNMLRCGEFCVLPSRKSVEQQTFPSQPPAMIRTWFPYAVGAAILYGLHQIFTKLAADRISDGLGSLVVESSAAITILLYLGSLSLLGGMNQSASAPGVWYCVITGICVGAGTVLFFLLFQKGGPLSVVPAILACGAALMAIAGILFFKEPASLPRILGIVLAIAGLLLLRI